MVEDNYKQALTQVLLNLEFGEIRFAHDIPQFYSCIAKILNDNKIGIVVYTPGKKLGLYIKDK